MKERVEVIKELYPNYLIVIKVKDKIKFWGIDKKIVDTFGYLNLKNVNKLVLDKYWNIYTYWNYRFIL